MGIEEEVMLLEPTGWTLVNANDAVRASLPADLAARVSLETHACVVELASTPHSGARGAVQELAMLRSLLDESLRRGLGLRAAVAGTHPYADWRDVAVSPSARYRRIHASVRELARREPTLALHVHVAVPDAECAVRALDGLRADLPLLLALSANSPFSQGRDTGLASSRTPTFSMFPRVGIPRRFGSYTAYVAAIDGLLRSGAIPEPTFVWWDARLQPKLGTVEVRVMDAQTRSTDTAPVAALVQCLVCLYADGMEPGPDAPELLDENRFRAARDGMQADLIDVRTTAMRPARGWLVDMIRECQSIARELGCAEELASAVELADRTGAVRQRELVAREGLRALLPTLSAEFVAATEEAAPNRLATDR